MPRLVPHVRPPRAAGPGHLSVRTLAVAALAATTALAVSGAAAAADGSGITTAGPRTAVVADHPKWAAQTTDRGAVDDTQQLTARVGLAGRDPAGLLAFATTVSTPGSRLYRHFLTPAQLRSRYGPTGRQVAAVRRWLTAAGLTVTDQNSHWIDVAGPATAMQRAFGARIDQFTVTGGMRHAPVGSVSVPATLASAVSSVAGLSQTTHGVREGATGAASAAERVKSRPAARDGATPGSAAGGARDAAPAASTPPCSPSWGAVTATGFPAGYSADPPYDLCGYVPGQLRGAYGVADTGFSGAGLTIAVVDAYGSPTMLADANRYSAAHGDPPFATGQYVEDVKPSAWTHLTDGLCQTPADWSGEEALDIEMAHGLAPGANIRYVGAASCTDQDLTAALAKIVDEHSADVVSASFGETMHQTTGDIDPAIVSQENSVFVSGAAVGIGFDVSTGDCGNDAAGLKGPNCDPLSARAQTEWPASSPWATAVGGTALAATAEGRYEWETNMGDRRSVLTGDGRSWDPFPGFFYFGGGGGTSEDFAQPAYQHGVVSDAQARTLGTGKTAPGPMRTVPDVAMNGDLLTAVFVGQTDPDTGVYGETQVGGTSAATPMFAGMQAIAMQAAQARFGFANPVLYSRAGTAVYTDVVDHPATAPALVSTVLDLGLNPDGTRKVRLYELGQDNGLTATPGYDLATGLGSPGPLFVHGFH